MNPGMVLTAGGISLPTIAFPMLMTLTIKTLIIFASTSLVVGAFPSFAGANPAGFISEPDVGTSLVWGPPKGAMKHNQKLLIRRSPTKRADGRLSFPQSEW